jgi:hypothetical protein
MTRRRVWIISLSLAAGLLWTPGVHAASEIWQTCFPGYEACVQARVETDWRRDLAERLCKEIGNGCSVPPDYYTHFACEKRAWDLKYRSVLLWADRNTIPAYCRNSTAEKYPIEAKKNLR